MIWMIWMGILAEASCMEQKKKVSRSQAARAFTTLFADCTVSKWWNINEANLPQLTSIQTWRLGCNALEQNGEHLGTSWNNAGPPHSAMPSHARNTCGCARPTLGEVTTRLAGVDLRHITCFTCFTCFTCLRYERWPLAKRFLRPQRGCHIRPRAAKGAPLRLRQHTIDPQFVSRRVLNVSLSLPTPHPNNLQALHENNEFAKFCVIKLKNVEETLQERNCINHIKLWDLAVCPEKGDPRISKVHLWSCRSSITSEPCTATCFTWTRWTKHRISQNPTNPSQSLLHLMLQVMSSDATRCHKIRQVSLPPRLLQLEILRGVLHTAAVPGPR